MIIIGEKINGTRNEVGAAIGNRDSQLIKRLAREQIAAGAEYLDLNAGTSPIKGTVSIIFKANRFYVQNVIKAY